ncbi:MAG: hypothetical protein F6K19_42235, partial [Cyanothece sp. SIO1E1]|nr:hypothetical protein [Cyanothece sp. SIO1E1]
LSLTAAINVASQIGYGRALYRKAQGAIANWSVERAEIWAAWEAEDNAYADNAYEDNYDDDY